MARLVTSAFLLPLLLLISVAAPPPPILLSENDANWAAAVNKGTKLFQQLQSGCYPDKTNPLDREALSAIGYRITGRDDQGSAWPPIFGRDSSLPVSIVRMFKWTENEKAYWNAIIRRDYFTPWEDHTSYNNVYSPRNGLIAGLSAKEAGVETVPWSDATFALWEAVTSSKPSNIKNLRYVNHHCIQDAFTMAIIHRALGPKPERKIFFGVGTEAFLALLGTPKGVGVLHLLMEHKRQLGIKTIVEVTAIKYPDGLDLVFEIRKMSPKSSTATSSASCEKIAGPLPFIE